MTDWNELRNCASGDPAFVAAWRKSVSDGETSEREWVSRLRADGYRAAHPNDGWVDRENNSVQLVYPQFKDKVEVGCLVMLGWCSDKASHRPVVVTHIEPLRMFTGRQTYRYYFADKEPQP